MRGGRSKVREAGTTRDGSDWDGMLPDGMLGKEARELPTDSVMAGTAADAVCIGALAIGALAIGALAAPLPTGMLLADTLALWKPECSSPIEH